MQSPGRAYAFGASGVFASSIVSAVAGVLSLWLLARILNTDEFAGYVVAMSIFVLVGYNAGLALERVLVLRLAERPAQDSLVGRGMMLRVLGSMVALALLATAGVLLYARFGGVEGVWLTRMAPIILATTVAVAVSAWFQANHRVGTSAVMQGLTDGSRCFFFLLVFLAGFGAASVAASAVLAAVVPILILLFLARGKSEPEPSNFTLRDVGLGLQFLVMRVSQMGLRQFDIIIVGLFATSVEIAYYAVAARISAVASVGYTAFSKTYVPRVRNHLAREDWPAIEREFHAARLLSLLATLAAAILFYVFGAVALGIFGDFANGYPALVILMAAQVLTAAHSLHTEHLSMSGHLTMAAAIRVTTTAVFVLALFLLVPHYFTLGAAISAAIAAVVFSVAGSLALWHLGRPRPGKRSTVPVAVAAATAMIVGALVPALWAPALAVLLAATGALVVAERSWLFHVIANLRSQ